jgi:predicted RNase H-like HicB family nuclease
MRLQVLFVQEPDGRYSVGVPALPGCVSEGDTLDEARANIREAAAGWLDVERGHGRATAVADDPAALAALVADFAPSSESAQAVEEMDL